MPSAKLSSVYNRYFQWRDMGMNVIGAALGLVVYFTLRAYRNRAN